MSEKLDIIFKTDAALWEMMAAGTKQWDARQCDLADERIWRLLAGYWEGTREPGGHPHGRPGRLPYWSPAESFVSFLNKETGEILKFRFRGFRFAPWAPGWVFLELGGLIERKTPGGEHGHTG